VADLYTRRFLTLWLTHFCFMLSVGLFYLLPLFLKTNGADRIDVGLIMGSLALAAVLARPLTTWVIDRLGRRKTVLLGAFLFIVTPLLYLVFKGPVENYYWTLILVRVLHGVGLSLCLTAPFTWVSDLVPPGRMNEGLGIFGVSGLIAMAVGPALGELVVSQAGFDALFWIASGLAVFPVILVRTIPDRAVDPGSESEQERDSFFRVLIRPDTMPITGIALLFGFGMASTMNFVTLYAQQRGISVVSIFFIAFSGAAIVTRIFGGRLADRVGEGRIIPFALALSSIGFLSLIPAASTTFFMVSGFIVGLAHGFLFPGLTTTMVKGRPYNMRPKLIAIFTGAVDGGIFAGSLVLGRVGESLGFGPVYLIACLAMLSALAVFMAIPVRKRNNPDR